MTNIDLDELVVVEDLSSDVEPQEAVLTKYGKSILQKVRTLSEIFQKTHD